MSENFIRHFVAAIGTIIAGLIYWAGYVGGQHGWWWAGFGVLVVYIIVYQTITAGGK